jgi:hypothetical protein
MTITSSVVAGSMMSRLRQQTVRLYASHCGGPVYLCLCLATGSPCNVKTIDRRDAPCPSGAWHRGDGAGQRVGLPGTFPRSRSRRCWEIRSKQMA